MHEWQGREAIKGSKAFYVGGRKNMRAGVVLEEAGKDLSPDREERALCVRRHERRAGGGPTPHLSPPSLPSLQLQLLYLLFPLPRMILSKLFPWQAPFALQMSAQMPSPKKGIPQPPYLKVKSPGVLHPISLTHLRLSEKCRYFFHSFIIYILLIGCKPHGVEMVFHLLPYPEHVDHPWLTGGIR
ncbi:hypothetical protein mRhiFer1_010017 [Rhinolophus ferrumequinum]|uniref:Uncharacterized protein n=1 Tax=Rhinolophus ferrumequinum TaxID=59479 RepID=A0A7J7Y536_RHIFE|nr:hypothetical protein mRhiFer1_010017 [Rhinolophus ferrumequinum]